MNPNYQRLLGTVASSVIPTGELPPVVLITPKRFWRILLKRSQRHASLGNATLVSYGAARIEFMETVGGFNEAIAGQGTPIASSQLNGTTQAVDKAYDSLYETYWSSIAVASPSTEWIGWDFGAGNPRVINQFAWQARHLSDQQYSPIEGEVNSSADGVTWGFEWDFNIGSTWTTSSERKLFTNPLAQYQPLIQAIMARTAVVEGNPRSRVGLSYTRTKLISGNPRGAVSLPGHRLSLIVGPPRNAVSIDKSRISVIYKP